MSQGFAQAVRKDDSQVENVKSVKVVIMEEVFRQ